MHMKESWTARLGKSLREVWCTGLCLKSCCTVIWMESEYRSSCWRPACFSLDFLGYLRCGSNRRRCFIWRPWYYSEYLPYWPRRTFFWYGTGLEVFVCSSSFWFISFTMTGSGASHNIWKSIWGCGLLPLVICFPHLGRWSGKKDGKQNPVRKHRPVTSPRSLLDVWRRFCFWSSSCRFYFPGTWCLRLLSVFLQEIWMDSTFRQKNFFCSCLDLYFVLQYCKHLPIMIQICVRRNRRIDLSRCQGLPAYPFWRQFTWCSVWSRSELYFLDAAMGFRLALLMLNTQEVVFFSCSESAFLTLWLFLL